jgi:hypothetical protein
LWVIRYIRRNFFSTVLFDFHEPSFLTSIGSAYFAIPFFIENEDHGTKVEPRCHLEAQNPSMACPDGPNVP